MLPTRLRWILYGVAFVLTLVAVRWGDGEPEAPNANTVVIPAAAALERAPSAARDADASAGVQGVPSDVRLAEIYQRNHARPGQDPFGARSWDPPERAVVRRAEPPPPPPPPPQAPPLPYVYVGKLIEQDRAVVFLMRGDRNYRVRTGDVFDGAYRVESIEDERMVLTYVPLGIRQTLAFGAGAAATAALPSGADRAPRQRNANEDDD